jgi:hypothetical protein
MNEITVPLRKSGTLITKNLPISLEPNISASQNYYLHEERFSKACSGCLHNCVYVIRRNPINLKICPNSSAEITLKEEMNSIFIGTQIT